MSSAPTMAEQLLAERARQVGFAQGLLLDVISAADAPSDIRDQLMTYAVNRARRELAAGGRLAA